MLRLARGEPQVSSTRPQLHWESIPRHLRDKLEHGLECHIPISTFGPPGNEEAYLFEAVDTSKPCEGFHDVTMITSSSWVDTVKGSIVDIDDVKP